MSAIRWLVRCAQGVAMISLVAGMGATIATVSANDCDPCEPCIPQTCSSPKETSVFAELRKMPSAPHGASGYVHSPSTHYPPQQMHQMRQISSAPHSASGYVNSPLTPYPLHQMQQMRQMEAEGCRAYIDPRQQERLRERGVVIPPSRDEMEWMRRQGIAMPSTPDGIERMRRRYNGIADGQVVSRPQPLTSDQVAYLRQVWGDSIPIHTLPEHMSGADARGATLNRLAGRSPQGAMPENALPYFGMRPIVDHEPCEPRGPIAQALWNTPKPIAPVMPLPTYTTRGPRDFLFNDNPSSIGY